MAEADAVLANGRTNTEEAVKAAAEENEKPVDVQLPEERRTRFARTNFSRMKLEWNKDDRMMVEKIKAAVSKKMDEDFSDVLAIRYELFDLVREQVVVNGRKKIGEDGLPEWRTTRTGRYVEDWGKLTHRERINWIFTIQSNIIDWEERANEIWAESMFAKATWEEAFADGFESLSGGAQTIPAREARGKLASAEQRYFAIFLSYYSRQAEALVRNMKDLLLRISQVHQAASGR